MNKIKLPSNEIILYALALAGALTFVYVFLVMDGADISSAIGVLLTLRGVVLGGAAGLAMAKISHVLPRMGSKPKQEKYLQFAFVAFLVVAPMIISPVTYAKMSSDMMALPWLVRLMVSIAAGVFVDALTAGVAFASGKLEADDKPAQSEPPADAKPPKAKDKPGFVCSCGYVAKTQAGLNGHKRAHSKVVGYVASFEPVKAEQVSK